MASTRRPSNSTVPLGRIVETVLPTRPLRASSSDWPYRSIGPAVPAVASSELPSDIRRQAWTATNPAAGSPTASPPIATAASTVSP